MKCKFCNWHGSEDDPVIRRYTPETRGSICKNARNCRERQRINKGDDGSYSTGVAGYATAPQ